MPDWLRAMSFIFLGIQTGTSVTWDTVDRAAQWPLSIAFLGLTVVAVTWACTAYYVKRSGWDRADGAVQQRAGRPVAHTASRRRCTGADCRGSRSCNASGCSFSYRFYQKGDCDDGGRQCPDAHRSRRAEKSSLRDGVLLLTAGTWAGGSELRKGLKHCRRALCWGRSPRVQPWSLTGVLVQGPLSNFILFPAPVILGRDH